jgi:predicted transcriptional regulator
MEPESLKPTAFRAAAVSEAEYDAYFRGAARAVAIHLENVVSLYNPITLGDLRGNHESFQPPQSWHFLDETQLSRLFGGHTAHATLARLLDGHPI